MNWMVLTPLLVVPAALPTIEPPAMVQA